MDIPQLLLEHGIKPSVQRVAIMEYLLSHKTHPTVDEIHSFLSQKLKTLSKTTVYNTLKLFVDNNVALCIGIEDREARYDGDTTNHIHFKCKKCGRVYDITVDEVPGSPTIYQTVLNGCSIDETHIYFRGTCKGCNS